MPASLAHRFFDRFASLDRVHGRFTPDGTTDAKGKLQGSTRLVHEPATVASWEEHLAGRHGLGLCPIRDDGTCRWGAIDVDVYPLDHAKLMADVARLRLPLVAFRSKSGGAHLYLFLSEDVDAEVIRAALMDWAVRLGYGGVEIYPKQGRLSGKNDFGSWLNMPYYGGDRTTRYAIGLDGKSLSPEDALREAGRVAVDADGLAAVVPPDDPVDEEMWEGAPPCLRTLAFRGFPEGTRNNAMFNVAVYLRKRYGDEFANYIDRYNATYMLPALPSKEVQYTVKSVGKRSYGYKCKDQPIQSACNRQLCLGCEFGVGGGSDDPGVQFGDLIKIRTDPITWLWDVDGRRIQLGTMELTSQPKFHVRCIEELQKWPNIVKPATWQKIVRERLERAEIVDVPDDATAGGLAIAHLDKFCTTRAQAKAFDEVLLGKAYTEAGRTYFRLMDFVGYLHQMRVAGVNPRDTYMWLRKIGADHVGKNLKGKFTNLWHVPAFAAQTEPHDVPRTDRDAPEF